MNQNGTGKQWFINLLMWRHPKTPANKHQKICWSQYFWLQQNVFQRSFKASFPGYPIGCIGNLERILQITSMPAYLLFWPIVSGTDTPPGPYTSIYCLNGLQPTSNLPGFQNLSERSSQACSIAWCDTIAITGIIGFSSRIIFQN